MTTTRCHCRRRLTQPQQTRLAQEVLAQHQAPAASEAELVLAHTPDFVDAVLHGHLSK